ncbi:MAG: hypothetical protein ABIH87_02495 [bacterium]
MEEGKKKEPSLGEVLEVVESIKLDLDDVKKKMVVKEDLADFAKKSDLDNFTKKSDFDDFAKKYDLDDLAKKSDFDDILEIVTFIKDNAASKTEMQEGFDSLRSEIQEFRVEIRADLKTEIRGVRQDLEEIKLRLKKLEERTLEDENAIVGEHIKLKNKVNKLEEKVRQLEIAHAVSN